MLLRELSEKDFAPIFRAWLKEIYRGAYALLYTRDEFFVKTYGELTAYFHSPDFCCIGIIERNQVVGAVLGYGNPSTSMYYCPFLWVDEKHRNLHHATTLSEILHKYGTDRGYRRFACETDTKNPALKRLLKKLGFRQTRTIWLKLDR